MKYYYVIIIFFQITLIAAQTYQNVQVNINGGPEETSIYINPKNTNQIVAGANINYFYYSGNGGFNWTQGTIVDNQNGVWGDPAITADTANNFYYFHLAVAPGYTAYDRVVCAKSSDAGATWWSPGTYTGVNDPKVQDKVWPGIDRTHGPRGNWIYITWTQFDHYNSYNNNDSSIILFSRSTNGGLNWSTPLRISPIAGSCVDDKNTMEGAVPAVGPNGELYVGWAGPKIIDSQWGIFLQKSTDGGNSWLSSPIYVCDQNGGWDYNVQGIYRANGLPITCTDISNGPYRGNIYINWTDQAGTNDHDVKFIKSTDGGNTWGSIKRVNNDPAGKEQFFSWMCVDQSTGYIYFVFYDRRNYNYPDLSTDVYMARSTDGGETFTNFIVSSSPFIPNSGVFFGDYTNVSAVNGHVRPIWTRLQSGSLSVWTAIVEFPTLVRNENKDVPKAISLNQNFPNPFNPSTKIKFSIPKEEFTNLIIYDASGREVTRLVYEDLKPGSYEVEWNATNFSSGVYYYRFETENFIETKKMVLIK